MMVRPCSFGSAQIRTCNGSLLELGVCVCVGYSVPGVVRPCSFSSAQIRTCNGSPLELGVCVCWL